MLRFAANISHLFTEYPLIERFAAAREAGFEAVELLSPYEEPASTIAAALQGHGLKLILFNMPPPNFTGGPRGFAAEPESRKRFRHDFKRVMRYADLLQPAFIHVMAGFGAGDEMKECFIENLRWAAAEAPDQGLTIEPLNPESFPGYYLNDYDLAAEILDAVAAPNVALQYDTFHAAKIHGDALNVWADHGHRAAHVQISDPSDRGDPADSTFDFPSFFKRLKAEGYKGWISGEYKPKGRTEDSLGWIR